MPNVSTLPLIGVDADDTLWHNETLFRMTHGRFNALLAEYGEADDIEALLERIERRNLHTYGYGAKGFTLSMIETALEISKGQIPAGRLKEILDAGRELMHHPIDPLPGVETALAALRDQARLIVITKGDLFHQEQKLAASGLGAYFSGVEVVSEKTADVYERCFARHGGRADRGLMAGNSVRSDILPMIAAGGYAALIPYPLVWSHEAADPPFGHPRFRQLDTLADLPGWIAEIGL